MPTIEKRREMSRRSFLRKGIAAAFTAACALPFYAYYGERLRLETKLVELSHGRLPPALNGLRIVHFSDVHYGFYYGAKNLEALVKTINGLSPDLIAFTGDLFDAEVRPYAEECGDLLKKLEAPLGKFSVLGNHDYYARPDPILELYERAGFQLLRNRNVTLPVNGGVMQIAGVDDMLNGTPDPAATLAGLDPEAFTLLLAHEPDFADWKWPFPADLQLSGHSHGGQVRLPWIGAIHTPPGGRKYVRGLYRLAGERERFVYTGRGIGTTHLPIRLLCRPELTVITLLAQS